MNQVERQLDQFLRRKPRLGAGVYLARGAIVVGDVEIGERSSVWYNAVLRGDINAIRIGSCTNIQDNTVLHLADDLPCLLGDYVTVGHLAIVHACTVGNGALVGMGATVLDGAEIGPESIIGAGALVTKGTKVPAGSLVMGMPAKVVRSVTPKEVEEVRALAEKYAANAAYCLENGINVAGS